MRFCAFLMMPIVLLHQERSLEIVEPKNVTESACKTSVPSMTRGWMGVFFLRKSMIISFVLDMFSTRLLLYTWVSGYIHMLICERITFAQ